MKQYLLAALYNAPTTMQFNHDELMLMMLYNTGTRQGLVRELRLMQCYPKALRGLFAFRHLFGREKPSSSKTTACSAAASP